MTTVVPFKARGVRSELKRALDAREPVRIHRERIQPGVTHGYIVGLSRDFCLIAEVGDAIRFDGYLAIAIADISALETDPAREFVDRALAIRGEKLGVPAISVSTTGRRSPARPPRSQLVSVNMIEDEDGEISYVGEVIEAEANAIVLREIDPNAEWYPDTGAYEFEAIGSIGFGSGYLDALWQVAGAPGGPLMPRVPASDTVH